MSLLDNKDDLKELVETLNFKEKVDRSLAFIGEAYQKYGDGLVVANSLGKDSLAVWDLAKRVSPNIRVSSLLLDFNTKRPLNSCFRRLKDTRN